MKKIKLITIRNSYPLLVALAESRDMGAEGFKIDCLLRKNNIKSLVDGYVKKYNDTIMELGEDIMVDVLGPDNKPTGKKKPSGNRQIIKPEVLEKFKAIMDECGAVEIELPVPCATLEKIASARVMLEMDGQVLIDNDHLSGMEIGLVSWLFEDDKAETDKK